MINRRIVLLASASLCAIAFTGIGRCRDNEHDDGHSTGASSATRSGASV